MPPKMADRVSVDVLEARVANVESGLGELRSCFRALLETMQQQHSLLQDVSRMLGKKKVENPDTGNHSEGGTNSIGVSLQQTPRIESAGTDSDSSTHDSSTQLVPIKQYGWVDDYIQNFEMLMAQLPELPEEVALDCFMNGLSDVIRKKVRVHDPRELMHAMKLARDVEDELYGDAMGFVPVRPPAATSPYSQRPGHTSTVSARVSEQIMSGQPIGCNRVKQERLTQTTKPVIGDSVAARCTRKTRQLPYQEFVRLSEEGTCFRCGQPDGPLHRCPERKLPVMILDEDDDGVTGGEIEEEEVEEPTKGNNSKCQQTECNLLRLYCDTVDGPSCPKLLRMMGKIANTPVLVKVATGASCNFISEAKARQLGVPICETGEFVVELVNGHRLPSPGMCKNLLLRLDNCDVVADFHLFALGGEDVILGNSWIENLGVVSMSVSMGALSMSFKKDGKTVLLRGDPSL